MIAIFRFILHTATVATLVSRFIVDIIEWESVSFDFFASRISMLCICPFDVKNKRDSRKILFELIRC